MKSHDHHKEADSTTPMATGRPATHPASESDDGRTSAHNTTRTRSDGTETTVRDSRPAAATSMDTRASGAENSDITGRDGGNNTTNNGFNTLAWRLADQGVPFGTAWEIDNVLSDCCGCLAVIISAMPEAYAKLFAQDRLSATLLKLHDSQHEYVRRHCNALSRLCPELDLFKHALELPVEANELAKAIMELHAELGSWVSMDEKGIQLEVYRSKTVRCRELLGRLLEPELWGEKDMAMVE